MQITHSRSNFRKGFLLLEVVLALEIFAIACTGLAVAFHRMADAASLAQTELKMIRILDSALTEQIFYPTLREETFQVAVEDNDIELNVVISPITDLVNQDGESLEQMFRIQITAKWFEGGTWHERSVEGWRNNLMYQP